MSEWQPIETAPKDGTNVDLWAKCWRAQADDFVYQRFTDCWWTKGDSMTGRHEHWVGFESLSWYPTHWMPLPPPPVSGR